MITLGGAINLQQIELARLQRETASALAELDKILQQVEEQRRAKNLAAGEFEFYSRKKETLQNEVAEMEENAKLFTTVSEGQISFYKQQIKKLDEEYVAKTERNAKIEEKTESISKLKDELRQTKLLIDKEREKFNSEKDEIDKKQQKLEKTLKKNEEILAKIQKEKQELLLEKEILDMKKRDIDQIIAEMSELEKEALNNNT